MIKHTLGMAALAVALAAGMTVLPVSGAHADTASIKCHLRFNLAGWSLIYKQAEGNGTIRCDNGQQANDHERSSGLRGSQPARDFLA